MPCACHGIAASRPTWKSWSAFPCPASVSQELLPFCCGNTSDGSRSCFLGKLRPAASPASSQGQQAREAFRWLQNLAAGIGAVKCIPVKRQSRGTEAKVQLQTRLLDMTSKTSPPTAVSGSQACLCESQGLPVYTGLCLKTCTAAGYPPQGA